MEGINIVVFLVHCTAGLLVCETLPTHHLRFTDPETCRSAAAELIHAQRGPAEAGVRMADCRYRLATPYPSRIQRAQATPTQLVAATRRDPQ